MDASTIERFEEKSIPEPNSGCHLWMGAVDKDGYGQFQYKGKALITPVQAKEIKKLYRRHCRTDRLDGIEWAEEVAKRYGVSKSCVWHIWLGHTWGEV
jgi:DNA invertase Pin-like site-specific DNA recombinase